MVLNVFPCMHERLMYVRDTSSMNQLINHNGYKFSCFYLWSNKVHTLGLENSFQFLD
jgi:hypothetical protein